MMSKFDFVAIFVIAYACFGNAYPYNDEQPLFESASKELYGSFAEAFQRNVREMLNDEPEATRVSTDTLVSTDPPPKPQKIDDWPKVEIKLGQITAVAIHPDGNPVAFHRHDRVWNEE